MQLFVYFLHSQLQPVIVLETYFSDSAVISICNLELVTNIIILVACSVWKAVCILHLYDMMYISAL